jgi:hypothetical protein
MDHLMFSSCANDVTNLLAMCPHCKRDFINDEQLQLHFMRNTKCSALQDKACDKLSRITFFEFTNNKRKLENDDADVSYIERETYAVDQTVIKRAAKTASCHVPIQAISFENLRDTTSSFVRHMGNDVNDSHTILPLSRERYMSENHSFSSHSSNDNIKSSYDIICFDNECSYHGNTGVMEPYEVFENSSEEDIISNVNPNCAFLGDTIALHNSHSALQVSTEMIMLTDLYSMLNRRGVPLQLFELLSKWAWNNRKLLNNMSLPPMNRQQYLRAVSSMTKGPEDDWCNIPNKKKVFLSTGRTVLITFIGFSVMLKDMLSNTTLMDPCNIIWDKDVPVDTSNNVTPSCYDEVNSGTWWQEAQANECIHEDEYLWPIIMFIDGMKVSEQSTLRLEPITITFSRFKRSIRNQRNAWRTVAFMEESNDIIFKNGEPHKLSSTEKIQEYHDVLREVFKELQDIQKTGIAWKFPNDENHPMCGRKVVLKLPVQIIIGDCEGHDKLCGRYASHLQSVKGLCRDCDVPTIHADDIQWNCKFRTPSDVQDKSPEELQMISFYDISNALCEISFGGSKRGYFAALVPEILHVLKIGLYPLLFKGLKFSLSEKGKQYLDAASQIFVDTNRSITKFHLPPITAFRNGITHDVKGNALSLRGDEKHGRILLMFCLLSCSETFNYLGEHPKQSTEFDKNHWQRMLRLIEKCLAFQKWSCQTSHDSETIIGSDGSPETGLAHSRIKDFLQMLKSCCPTVTESEFRITKYHQCLHFPRIIMEHGSLLNVDSAPPESMAKNNLKDPAKHTQQRHSNLSYQTGVRYMEQISVLDCQRLIDENMKTTIEWSEPFQYIRPFEDENMEDNSHSSYSSNELNVQATGTRFTLIHEYDADMNTHNVTVQWKNRGETPSRGFDNYIITSVAERLFNSTDGGRIADSFIPGFTMLKVGSEHLYRAHPCFQNERPWHDWVQIRWSVTDEPTPARIEMFLDMRNSTITHDNIPFLNPDNDSDNTSQQNIPVLHRQQFLSKGIWAVVWSTKENNVPTRKRAMMQKSPTLSLAYRAEMEDFYRLVDVASFEQPCFAYLNSFHNSRNNFDGTAVILYPTETWADKFLYET